MSNAWIAAIVCMLALFVMLVTKNKFNEDYTFRTFTENCKSEQKAKITYYPFYYKIEVSCSETAFNKVEYIED